MIIIPSTRVQLESLTAYLNRDHSIKTNVNFKEKI